MLASGPQRGCLHCWCARPPQCLWQKTAFGDSAEAKGKTLAPKANVTLALLTQCVWDSIRAMEDTSVEFAWVKGHAGCWGNERVGSLSKAGAKLTEPCAERVLHRESFSWNHEGLAQNICGHLEQLVAEGWRLPFLPSARGI